MKAVKGDCSIAFKVLGCGTLGVRTGGGMEGWGVILCSKKWFVQKGDINVITLGGGGQELFKLFCVKSVLWSEAGFPLASECIAPMQRTCCGAGRTTALQRHPYCLHLIHFFALNTLEHLLTVSQPSKHIALLCHAWDTFCCQETASCHAHKRCSHTAQQFMSPCDPC